MGKSFQYTTLDRVLSKIYRDLGIEEISETDAIEWAGEALEGIGAIGLYEQAVAFVEVKNHKATMPNGLHSIIQIARNNQWIKEEKNLCPIDLECAPVTQEVEQVQGCGCGDALSTLLDCNGNLIGTQELGYYRPYFDLQWEYSGWMNSDIYKCKYSPVRLTNHSFIGSLVCDQDESIYHSCNDEYTIIGGNLIFSFKEGSVAIAYNRQVVDCETGYPMIPDDYSVITAITMYITMKYMARMWYTGREGYADKYQKAEADWQWYCRQAANAAMMPYGEDAYQNILEGRKQLIPNHKAYYSYFGKMGMSTNPLRGA